MPGSLFESLISRKPITGDACLLAQVDALDAQGLHQQSIDLLARETRHNNLAATTALAKRLVFGDRAPLLPEPGMQFLREAASRGCGEAATQLAVFSALGLYAPQSWTAALNLLISGARSGWAPAQGQVLALSGNASHLANALSRKLTASEWRALGADIDLASWLRPAQGNALSADPLVMDFADFLQPLVCQWLIEMAGGKLERAKVYNSDEKTTEVVEARSNTCAIFDLTRTDLVNVLVQAKMAASCASHISHMEAATVLHYNPGEQIRPHFDFIHPRSPDYAQQIASAGQRRITFLIYLNDDYTGGETVFLKLGIRNKGKAGSALYFVNISPDQQPDLRTQHAGSPPETGEKWIVSQFVRSARVIDVNV